MTIQYLCKHIFINSLSYHVVTIFLSSSTAVSHIHLILSSLMLGLSALKRKIYLCL